MQCRKNIPLRIVNNHIIYLDKKIILIAYHPLDIFGLLWGHAINFDYVGNRSNQHFTLAHDPFAVHV